MPKNLSDLLSMSWTTSAATPTAWRCPMIGFSQYIAEKSPSVTGTEKIRTEKRPCPSMPTNSSAASCSTLSPKASCVCVTSVSWPTDPKAFCQSAVNFWTLIPLCQSFPKDLFTRSCSNLPASISLVVLYAKRELWSFLPAYPSWLGILHDDRPTNKRPCSCPALCQSPRIASTCFITLPLAGRLSLPFGHSVPTNRLRQKLPGRLRPTMLVRRLWTISSVQSP